MKIIEVLNQDTKIERIAELILRDCQPFLQQSKLKHVYRAIKENDFFVKKQARQNRRPKDTDSSIHDLINEVGRKVFGWNIRNGVFAFGSFTQAENFSLDATHGNEIYNVYEIFPIGNFQFVYNIEYEDFYEFRDSNFIYNIMIKHFIKGGNYRELVEIIKKYYYDELVEYIRKTFSDDDLISAIKSKHEISFNVKSYYGLKIDSDTIEKYRQVIDILKTKLNLN